MLINFKFLIYLIIFIFFIPPAFAERKGNDGVISELRIGLSAHDVGPFSRKEESGKDVNFEVLFVSPKFLKNSSPASFFKKLQMMESRISTWAVQKATTSPFYFATSVPSHRFRNR